MEHSSTVGRQPKNGLELKMPKFKHDCKGCSFVGTDSQGKDWYLHGTNDQCRTIVRRLSNHPEDYQSVTIGETVKITNLEVTALRMGFQLNDLELIRYGQKFVQDAASWKSVKESRESWLDWNDESLFSNCSLQS